MKRCLWESGQNEIELFPGLISNTPFLYEGSETNSLRTIKCGAGEEEEDVQIYISTLSGMEIPSLLFSRWSFYYRGFLFAAFVARTVRSLSPKVWGLYLQWAIKQPEALQKGEGHTQGKQEFHHKGASDKECCQEARKHPRRKWHQSCARKNRFFQNKESAEPVFRTMGTLQTNFWRQENVLETTRSQRPTQRATSTKGQQAVHQGKDGHNWMRTLPSHRGMLKSTESYLRAS